MIKPGAGKSHGVMALRAILNGGNVGGVDRGILARCLDPVVARRAIVDDAGMTEHRWRKGTARCVTDAAIFNCCNVVDLGILAGCGDSVVAGIAPVADDVRTGVVDERIGKICRVVAEGAIRVCVLVNRSNRFR